MVWDSSIAKFGWRVYSDSGGRLVAEMWPRDAGDVVTIAGFESRAEAFHFIAVYWVLMANAREDEATKLLRHFTSTAYRPS